MNRFLLVFLIAGAAVLEQAVFEPAAFAQDHPNFSGNWQLEADKSENAHAKNISLAIQQNDDNIAMTADDEGKAMVFKCSTDGKNCKAKGEPAEISIYYNGPMLVELDTEHGDHVIKKRLHMGADGKTLEMELMRVNPPGPTEKLVFVKKQ